jgi:hypothetical protein
MTYSGSGTGIILFFDVAGIQNQAPAAPSDSFAFIMATPYVYTASGAQLINLKTRNNANASNSVINVYMSATRIA